MSRRTGHRPRGGGAFASAAVLVAVAGGGLAIRGLRRGRRRRGRERGPGDAPGSAHGMLYLAAHGPALPLRETQTSPNRPGGSQVCGPTSNSNANDEGVNDFSAFNVPVTITAPADPMVAPSLR